MMALSCLPYYQQVNHTGMRWYPRFPSNVEALLSLLLLFGKGILALPLRSIWRGKQELLL